MQILDYSIIGFYLVGLVTIGLWVSKKASGGMDDYFLGGKDIPWWALASSGMSSNLDITGTMINTAFIFVLGLSGLLVEIRGGVVLVLAFLFIFMGKWLFRSGVMTMAEWMVLRFGNGSKARIARLTLALVLILQTFSMIVYFCVGSGKFISEILNIPPVLGLPPKFVAAFLMVTVAMIYTVASGLRGVVWTDVFQSILIFIVILFVCIKAVLFFNLPASFQVSIPMQDGSFHLIESTREAWTSLIPRARLDFPADSFYSIYNFFLFVIVFYFLRTCITGFGSPGGYMDQRFFSAKSEREASLLAFTWVFLLAFRWPFIVAIAIMGIVYGSQNGVIQDPEMVLPVVIKNCIPVGMKGLMIAGLLAAAMSTFDSTVNAAAAFWVNDIYRPYFGKEANEKTLLRQGKWFSILLVAGALLFSLLVTNINEIWGWIMMSLTAGFMVPLVLTWYWERLNSAGFIWGIAVGISAAFLQAVLFPRLPEYISFLAVSGISLAAVLIATLVTRPEDPGVLDRFYKKVRPFGFWNTIRKRLPEVHAENRKENRRDLSNLLLAIPWQLCWFFTLMLFITKNWTSFSVMGILTLLLSVGLYFRWYKQLAP